jgi:hypothetical protein
VIIVIEGASAAGKTTWCRRFASDQVLFEGEPSADQAPEGASDPNPAFPRAVAEYWSSVNAERWSTARGLSDRLGWVACDTDPFKLHWVWTLWVEGLAPLDYWEASRDLSRSAFADGRLGLPDLVFFADLDPETLRRQKTGDPTRTRSRHDLHIRISSALKRWYLATAALDPARVEFRLPANGLETGHLQLGRRPERSGAPLFDRLMAELDVRRDPSAGSRPTLR